MMFAAQNIPFHSTSVLIVRGCHKKTINLLLERPSNVIDGVRAEIQLKGKMLLGLRLLDLVNS